MELAVENLEVYRRSQDLSLRVHAMTLALPRFEMFEEGSQIRRSSKRIPASLVEGMAARKYKGHFLFYLYRALGSSDETQVHLSLLHGTGSLKDETLYGELSQSYAEVSRMLFAFIQSVERRHERPHYLKGKAGEPDLPVADDPDPPF